MITEEVVRKSLAMMASSAANHEYFFMKLKTADWIEPLAKAGRFKDPPPARRQEDTIAFPPWPESQYLVRVAGQAPETVKNIILKVPQTDNQRVHQDFIEAALAMPGGTAAEIADEEAAWIREQKYLYILYPDKVADLIAHFAKEGQAAPALKLARVLIGLRPNPRPTISIGEGDEALDMPQDAVAKFDQWHYQQSLHKITKPLVTANAEGTIDLLTDILEFALKSHVRPGPTETEGEDYSWIWRAHIELEGHGDPKDALVSALRDATVLVATSDPGRISRIVDELVARQWRVFRRIAAHVLETVPNIDSELINKLIPFSFRLQDYPETEPELANFLKHSFAKLPETTQDRLLSVINAGPSLDTFKKNFELAQKRAPTDEEVKTIAESWRLQWIEPIHEHLRTDEWRNRYQELVKRFGQPVERMESHGAFVGPTSPKTVEELRQLKPEELMEYLDTWVPSNDWASPTSEGLGRALTSVISAEPGKLSQAADKLIGLDPTYISSAIEGFAEAVKKGLTLDWDTVLKLCEWAVEQNAVIPNRKVDLMEGDPDWIASRMAVGRLLREALVAKSGTELPKQFRTRVWVLLTSLVRGPDPLANRVQKYEEKGFPGTLSLNTPRGIALDAVIDYGLWVHPYDQKKSEAGDSSFSEAPETKELLEEVIARDSSLAAAEVLGRRFPNVFALDRAWTQENVDRIFKPGAKLTERVAWINYILFCQAYDELLPMLSTHYQQAIDVLTASLDSSWMNDYRRSLVTHLVSFFWRRRIDWEDKNGLLCRFFKRAPVESRAYFFEVIGRSLGGPKLTEQNYEHLLGRLRKFLADRVDAIRQSGEKGELEPFGWWFIARQFDSDWLMDNLLTILRLSHKISPDWRVVECLSKDAEDTPLQAVQALEQIVVGDKDGWAIYGWEEHARKLLKTALQSNDDAARESAIRVINLIGSRGQYGFRDLLRKSTDRSEPS